MRDDRLNYVLVGSFVLAMVAGLVTSIALLTGRTSATDAYYTSYEDATGLKFGTQVLYMGYPVGQVDDVRPVLENGRLRFEVDLAITEEFAGWNVPQDSVAEVRASGLLAAVTIDIRAGDSEQSLDPGDRIRGLERRDVLGAVTETANALRQLTLTSVKPLLENLNRHVGVFGDALERRGVPLVESLSTLSEQLAARAPEVIDEFLATTTALRRVSERLQVVLSDENADKLHDVVGNVEQASEQLRRLTESARRQLDVILGAGTTVRIESMLENLDAASGEALALARSARAGTGALLADENVARVRRTLENAEAASAGVRELLRPEQRRKVEAAVDDTARAAGELGAMVAETREQVRALLGPETVRRLDEALVNISGASANVARLSANLDRRVGDVLSDDVAARLKGSLENFSRAAANVASLSGNLERSRETLDALLETLAGAARDNRADVRASVRDLQHSLGTIARHVDAVARNLEGSSRNLFEFSRRVKANPALLLRGADPAPDRAAGGGG